LSGDMEAALKAFKTMQDKGLEADAIIFNTLMDGCVTCDRLMLCDEMYALMLKKKIPPSCFTLTILVKRYGRAGNLAKAFEICDRLPKEYNFKVSEHATTCLISSCIANKRIDKAFEVMEKMKRVGPAPDSKAFEKIIAGCIRFDRFEQACRYVEDSYGLHGPLGRPNGNRVVSGLQTPSGEIKRCGGIGEDTLKYLISSLCKRGLSESMGVPLLQKLRSHNVKLPQSLFSAALNDVMNKVPQRQAAAVKRAPWARDGRRGR